MMGNHYHLLVETPAANLVAGMKWLQATCTQRYHSRHSVCGHFFQGRYQALVVDGAAGNYVAVVSTYMHLNPRERLGIGEKSGVSRVVRLLEAGREANLKTLKHRLVVRAGGFKK